MSIVDGKGLIEWEGGLFAPDSQLLPRVRWAFAQIRAEGGSITLNEAGRPFGVSSDQYARSSQDTESGLSTVWFQWGRYERGETPSAANPAGGVYASEHTQGIAIDCNANPTSLRAEYFPMVGLENTIASESWHWAIRGPSQVDLSAYADTGFTPFANEEIDMAAREDILAAVSDLKAWVLGGAVQWILIQDGPTITALSPGNVVHVPTMDHLILFQRRGILPEKIIQLPHNEAEFITAFYETSEQNDNTSVKLLSLISQAEAQHLNAEAA